MAQYKVVMTRVDEYSARIVVEATSEEDAVQVALREAYNNVSWSRDETGVPVVWTVSELG